MPNLIHSLDATTLSLLYKKFSNLYKNSQFLSIHDCFGTTIDKVDTLKTMLASVYKDLYSNDPYLDIFYANLLKYIENAGITINKDKKLVEIILDNETKQFELHSIEWVKNNKQINRGIINRIDSQYILI